MSRYKALGEAIYSARPNTLLTRTEQAGHRIVCYQRLSTEGIRLIGESPP